MRTILKDKIKLKSLLGGTEVCEKSNHEKNLVHLKYLIKYFSKVKNQGLIDDEKFKLLVAVVCQNFIEKEIEARVNKKIINSIRSLFSSSRNVTQ